MDDHSLTHAPPPLERVDLGKMAFGRALERQKARHEAVQKGQACEALFLVEHPKVITLGRNAHDEHILHSQAQLAQDGVPVFSIGRGGDVTYHGPGQCVAYPILALGPKERDVGRYVDALERWVIAVVAEWGIAAHTRAGMRGIWVGDAKLAAIGVRIARWTTMHGIALNVSPNMAHFDWIVPCGLHGYRVTSLAELLGPAACPSVATVFERLAHHAGHFLHRTLTLESQSQPQSQPRATS